jgi:hypothetical protein
MEEDRSGRRDAGDSARRWRAGRRRLKEQRYELTRAAARLYPDVPRVGSTLLLGRAEWLAPRPLDLARIRLTWFDPPPPARDVTGPASAGVRPLRTDTGERYASYAAALAAIDPPALLENRVCYRLLGADLAADMPALNLTRARYFDGINVGEAIGHELAQAGQEHEGLIPGRLRLRQFLGDPTVLRRRTSLLALSVLTLRVPQEGTPSFMLHWRDPAAVTHAGGLYQVMPVGVFQPVAEDRAAERRDLDLWRGMAREFSEEFLGTAEEYEAGYERRPFFAALDAARRSGDLRIRCLGLGVDPLTFAADLLCVAVVRAAAFDALFPGLVDANAEGRVVNWPGMTGVPFTAEVVARFAGGTEPVQPAGAAVLERAWRFRRELGIG